MCNIRILGWMSAVLTNVLCGFTQSLHVIPPPYLQQAIVASFLLLSKLSLASRTPCSLAAGSTVKSRGLDSPGARALWHRIEPSGFIIQLSDQQLRWVSLHLYHSCSAVLTPVPVEAVHAAGPGLSPRVPPPFLASFSHTRPAYNFRIPGGCNQGDGIMQRNH